MILSTKLQEFRSGAKVRLFIAGILAAAMLVTSAEGQVRHSVQGPRARTTDVAAKAELNRRIEAANAAQRSGSLAAIAEANRRLLAYGLRLMGQLRASENAYPQAGALYRASLSFEALPGIHSDLALADGISGNEDEAIQQANLALAEGPPDVHVYITLARAYSAKKEFAEADKALVRAGGLHPDIDTLYLLAVTWLQTGQPNGREHADAIFAEMKRMAGDSGSLHVLMGRAYRDANLMPDAVKEFKRAIALDTTTPHAHYFLGLAYLATNEWNWSPQVQSEMEEEVRYHPKDYLANYMLGFLASGRREYARADKYLKVAAVLQPDLPEPFLFMGLDAFAEGDNKSAEELLRKAVQLTGDDEARSNYQIRRAYVDLGRILAREGREQEADHFVAKARDLENKVMRQTQQDATKLMIAEGGKAGDLAAVVPLETKGSGHSQSGSNQVADAAARLSSSAMMSSGLGPEQRKQSIAAEDLLRPIVGQSYSDLATAEAIQKNYSSALKHYQSAERWNPDIAGLEKNLGQAAYHAGNYPEAARGLAKAVQENPNSAALRAMLGMSYYQMKEYGSAATTFYPLGEAAMRDPVVGYAWAASLAKTGDLKDATQVLTIYQGGTLSNQALLLVGQLWVEIGDYDQAVSTLHRLLASDPSFPKAHFAIALADIHSNKWADAATELKAELAIDPQDTEAMYNLGFVDLQVLKNEEAMKLFRQVIAKKPDSANAQYQIGKLYMDQGKPRLALPYLEAAARLSPDKAYVHYQLQAAYRKLSRTADADRELAVYEKIKTASRAASTASIQQQTQQKPE
ncbi:MAG: tetratricopeptide repeat protein [Acidobacteriaceae bacterium]